MYLFRDPRQGCVGVQAAPRARPWLLLASLGSQDGFTPNVMTRRDLGTHSHHNILNREKKIKIKNKIPADVGLSLELSAHLVSTKGNGASCCFHPVLAGSLNPK